MYRITLIVKISFLLFSCNNIQSSNEKNDTTLNSSAEYVPGDTIEYAYSTFKKNSGYFLDNEDGIDTSYYQITYPIFKQENINNSIKKLILYDDENTVSESAQSFLDGFDEFVGDSNIENIFAAWTKDVNSRVIANSPLLITLYTDTYEYSGGAHGHRHTFYANIDLRNNKLLSWKDILQTDKFEALTEIAEKKFRHLNNLTEDAPLDRDFFFASGIFELNDNFGLTKDSLIIYFNEYEIKPYSEGPTSLIIPYEELKDIFSIRGKEYIQSLTKI